LADGTSNIRPRYDPDFHPLRRFMDDFRSFAAQQLGVSVRPLPHGYGLMTLGKDGWAKCKQTWRNNNIGSQYDWESAVGGVQLFKISADKRTDLVINNGFELALVVFDAYLIFPEEVYDAYREGKVSPFSEIYCLAASACLRLIELESLNDGTHFVGPTYLGDTKALNLLQRFRDEMTTRQFMRHYAPRVRSIQLQRSSAVPATSKTSKLALSP
jgi:hypothetical protein